MPATKYTIKKSPADPFRGDWYIHEADFSKIEQAIVKAAELTLKNYEELQNSWDEFGYEWSVFEEKDNIEKKLWEGYKYIQFVREGKTDFSGGEM